MNAESSQAQGQAQDLAVAGLATADFDKIIFSRVKDARVAADIIDKTNEWANGQFSLTQLIYQYIQRYSTQIIRAEGANIVDEIVQGKIIKNWRSNAAATHFTGIEEILLNHPNKDSLLIVYTQILWHGSIRANTLPNMESEEAVLLRSGLVECIEDELYIANAIYASVFDKAWIERRIPSHLHKVSAKRRTNMQTIAFSARPAERTASSLAIASQADDRSINQAIDQLDSQIDDQLTGQSITSTVSLPNDSPSQKTQLPRTLKAQSSRQKFLPAWLIVFTGAAVLVCFQLLRSFGLGGLGSGDSGAIALRAYQQSASPPTDQPDISQADASQLDGQLDSQIDSKTLFDTGLEHATNGRWLPMLQKFCSIPPSSAYFVPAQQQLENWISLYPEDIRQAFASLYAQPTQTCSLIKNTPS